VNSVQDSVGLPGSRQRVNAGCFVDPLLSILIHPLGVGPTVIVSVVIAGCLFWSFVHSRPGSRQKVNTGGRVDPLLSILLHPLARHTRGCSNLLRAFPQHSFPCSSAVKGSTAFNQEQLE